MRNLLLTVTEAAELIKTGAPIVLAGAEDLMSQLPRGSWIGGSTPYFIAPDGAITTETHLLCTVLDTAIETRITVLHPDTLPNLAKGRYQNGFTCLLIAAFGETHRRFALDAPTLPHLFHQPVIGWCAGVNVAGGNDRKPCVVDGSTGIIHYDAAVALYIHLPEDCAPEIDIVNPFTPGAGPTITFPEISFEVDACFIDGQPARLSDYMAAADVSTRLPLIADYAGAMVNVAIRSVETDKNVRLFAPVMTGQSYRFAKPITDYAGVFARTPVGDPGRALACNCVLNFLYAEMEGKSQEGFIGPVTFGEIGYILLTQTSVALWLEPRS